MGLDGEARYRDSLLDLDVGQLQLALEHETNDHRHVSTVVAKQQRRRHRALAVGPDERSVLRGDLVHGSLHQRPLASEVVVDLPVVDAGAAGDVAHAHGGRARFGQ